MKLQYLILFLINFQFLVKDNLFNLVLNNDQMIDHFLYLQYF